MENDQSNNGLSWRSLAQLARMQVEENPMEAVKNYRAAVFSCRRDAGLNSKCLADLLDEAAALCSRVGLNDEAENYRSKSSQIKVYNEHMKMPFKAQFTTMY